MNSPSWVLDTNVVVSGLLSPHGPPARLVDALLAGNLRLTWTDRIAAEYREVLARPRLAIPAVRREAFLALLSIGDHVAPSAWSHPRPSDPDDLPFLEAAVHATDQVLVTGNTRHFPSACRGTVKVLTPAKAWARLGNGAGQRVTAQP